jgi:hypothetical protein
MLNALKFTKNDAAYCISFLIRLQLSRDRN